MATDRHRLGHWPTRTRPGYRWSVMGLAALVAAKLADALTTAVALLYLPLTEGNPAVRSLMDQVGIIPGLVIGSGLAVVFIALVTESGVYTVGRLDGDPRWASRVRSVGYGVPALLFAVVALHNLVLILLVL